MVSTYARVGVCCKVSTCIVSTLLKYTASTFCCKATLLPSDAFGPGAPEGSEQFRFETIASKPSFILEELEATQHPVVFLDTDLEFHRYTYYGEAYYGDAYYGNTYFGETHYLPTYHRPRVSQVRCYLRTYSLTNLLTY